MTSGAPSVPVAVLGFHISYQTGYLPAEVNWRNKMYAYLLFRCFGKQDVHFYSLQRHHHAAYTRYGWLGPPFAMKIYGGYWGYTNSFIRCTVQFMHPSILQCTGPDLLCLNCHVSSCYLANLQNKEGALHATRCYNNSWQSLALLWYVEVLWLHHFWKENSSIVSIKHDWHSVLGRGCAVFRLVDLIVFNARIPIVQWCVKFHLDWYFFFLQESYNQQTWDGLPEIGQWIAIFLLLLIVSVVQTTSSTAQIRSKSLAVFLMFQD